MVPLGVRLQAELSGHSAGVQRLAWSREGTLLASASVDYSCKLWSPQKQQCLATLVEESYIFDASWNYTDALIALACSGGYVAVWDTQTYLPVKKLEGHHNNVISVDWHPTASLLASGGWDMTAFIWDYETGEPKHIIKGHKGEIAMVRWSPNGTLLATASGDKTVRIWNTSDATNLYCLEGHRDRVLAVAFSPDGRLLATGCGDRQVRLWDLVTGKLVALLEAHTAAITSVSFSSDGRILASKSRDNTVMLFDTTTMGQLCTIDEPGSSTFYPGLAFHPHDPLLATLGNNDLDVRLWEISEQLVQHARMKGGSVTYCNAKVAIVGDPSVGKTALGLVLSGHKYRPTDSTHNRNVWTIAVAQHELAPEVFATRELLLWDLAGQPGYRLLHQLHLRDVLVAVLVFDARNTTDPFGSIRYWVSALNAAHHEAPERLPTLILVSARHDVGPVSLSQERIDGEMKALGIRRYFETSSKTGLNVFQLRSFIIDSVDWEAIPVISSTLLLMRIREFILSEKDSIHVLMSEAELGRTILERANDKKITRAHILTCLDQLESTGLVCRLRSAKYVLLKPELIDSYCAALLQAAQADPTGGGSLSESTIIPKLHTHLPLLDRLEDPDEERLVVDAALDALIGSEVALRQNTGAGMFVVFPSQLTREPSTVESDAVMQANWSFSGAIQNLYATLVVRLGYSGLFIAEQLWAGLGLFECSNHSRCFVRLTHSSEGGGVLELSCDKEVSPELADIVAMFISDHLRRFAAPNSVRYLRQLSCHNCSFIFPQGATDARERRGFKHISCPICDEPTQLASSLSSKNAESQLKQQRLDDIVSSYKEKVSASRTDSTADHQTLIDVFISYNRGDSAKIDELRGHLRILGIRTWVDRFDTRPFESYHSQLQSAITEATAAAICLGPYGIGKWQEREIAALLEESHRRPLRLGVVLLPGFTGINDIPVFLRSIHHLSAEAFTPESIAAIVWGITGVRPLSLSHQQPLE